MSRNLVKEIEQLNHQRQMVGMNKEQKKKYEEKITKGVFADMFGDMFGNPLRK